MSREHLLAVVREAYQRHDPMPVGLVARMQDAARAEASGIGLDLELMLLAEESRMTADVRSVDVGGLGQETATAYTLRFVLGELDLLVRVATGGPAEASARIDGWVVPPEPMTVRAVRDDELSRGATLSDSGRFEFTDLTPGLIRLRFEPLDNSRAPFATPTFEI